MPVVFVYEFLIYFLADLKLLFCGGRKCVVIFVGCLKKEVKEWLSHCRVWNQNTARDTFCKKACLLIVNENRRVKSEDFPSKLQKIYIAFSSLACYDIYTNGKKIKV